MKYEKIKLGKNNHIDNTAILGYPCNRKIGNKTLTLGNNATVRTGSTIYVGNRIGKNFETGHNVVIREQNKIGNDFSIWNNSTVDYGCKIGNNVKIHCNCYIAQFTELEDDVFLAPGVTFANDIHPGCPNSRKCMKGPHIEKGVQIGVNVTVLPYVRIGKHSLIGGGSVVTSDIPPYSVAYGSPARVHKNISDLKCTTGYSKSPYSFIKKENKK